MEKIILNDNGKFLQNLKVIHVEHCSHSYFVSDNRHPDEVVKGSWGTQVTTQLKKFYPKIEVECWFPEKTETHEREFEFKNIKARIFPTTFSPRYGLDFSLPMLLALKEEVEKCWKDGKNIIIHIHEIHNLHGLTIATFFKNQKLICQHHGGSWPLKHLKQTSKYRWFFPLFWIGQVWENRVLKNIQYYFALTPEEIEYLKKKTNSKIKFQTMGIEDDYFKKVGKNAARRKLGFPLDKKILLYIGRINEEKGIGYLLDAMKSMKNIELKIIGYLQDVEKFKNYAFENNLKNVEFLGGVFGKRKILYLNASDGLILPSSKEGAPVTIMESLACGTPIIATDVGGVPLMVENNREGIVIKQKNSEEIIKGVKKLFSKKWNVRRHGKKYKWKGIIDDTVKIYEEMMK